MTHETDGGNPAGAPPFVLTRESRIRIDADGAFWHEGERVEHAGLAAALASWIALDPATGRYILRNALDWCFITVDDAPLVVRAVEIPAEPGAHVMLALSDGSREPLATDTLRLASSGVPYCRVKRGTLPARFGRAAAFALLDRAREAGDGYVLALPEGDVAVVRRDA